MTGRISGMINYLIHKTVVLKGRIVNKIMLKLLQHFFIYLYSLEIKNYVMLM